MSSTRGGRLIKWLKQSRVHSLETRPDVMQEARTQPSAATNPVTAYYLNKARKDTQEFYQFAIQSRSIAIRDVLARASSNGALTLSDLLFELTGNQIEHFANENKQVLESLYDGAILLRLADLLANTARDDLDTDAAVRIYDFVGEVFGIASFSKKQVLTYIEALNDIGRYETSDRLARQFSINDSAPLQLELLSLQRLRATSSLTDWVRALNDLYIELNMTRVKLIGRDTSAVMDRLAADGVEPIYGPTVSVIMPTFTPGPGIYTAVRGLLEQSWQNLEIIIVDDASPERYNAIFRDLEQLDPRIRVLHRDSNAGAYVARNAGLAVATGEFITTADDDDWSHPDKIASQVLAMLDDSAIIATVSSHIRATESLVFRRVNSFPRYLQMNYSSLMFRRSIVDLVGDWDTVNRGADSEFYSRVVEYFGRERVVKLSDRPLAFSRVWSGSLTSGEMYRGFIAIPRIFYMWAYRQWRWDLGKEGKQPRRIRGSRRPYAVPATFEAGQRNQDLGLHDVVYVADFFRQSKHVDLVVNEIETLVEQGFRVGYIHIDSPRTVSRAGIAPQLSELQVSGKLTHLSFHDNAQTKLLVIYDASLGMFTDQIRTELVSRRTVVIERELPTLASAALRLPTDYRVALKNLDATFRTRAEIVGGTMEDQTRLRKHVAETRLLHDDMVWHTHLRENPSEARPVEDVPVVGFHCFGNKYRWPTNLDTFDKVYKSKSFRTRFLGQMKPAKQKFGASALEPIDIVDHKSVSVRTFLDTLNFWVYFPDHKLHDQPWPPVLAAMQSGKVVILPPHLKGLYEEAAVYAQPDDLVDTIATLAKDDQEYLAQAKRAQDYVAHYFSRKRLCERVSKLL